MFKQAREKEGTRSEHGRTPSQTDLIHPEKELDVLPGILHTSGEDIAFQIGLNLVFIHLFIQQEFIKCWVGLSSEGGGKCRLIQDSVCFVSLTPTQA